MSIETFLLGLVVGLIAGWFASVVVNGGSSGLVNDIVAGVVGAFLGGLLFRGRALRVFEESLPQAIFVAFLGAIIVLLLLRGLTYLRARLNRSPPS